MGDVTELREADRWKEPAHPSAQLVARESQAAVDRLLQQLDSLDTKASFLAAGGFVLIAGFIAGIAAKAPTNPHVQDAAIAALILDLAALLPILYTWWPRTIDIPPHPRGLREQHFNDVEARALQAIADRIVTSFDDTKEVADKKAAGIKVAMISMLIAASVTVSVFALDLIQGATH